MHKHFRARIRHNAVSLLKAGVDIGNRVYSSRPHPVWLLGEMPLCLVYFTNEPIKEDDTAPTTLLRTLNLTVDVLCSEPKETAEDFLDDRAYEVEASLFYDNGWTMELEDVRLVNTVPYTPDSKSETVIYAARLTFEIDYKTDSGEYDTTDEFLSFVAKIQTLEGAETEDEVVIREE